MIKGSGAQKQRLNKTLWMIWFDEKIRLTYILGNSRRVSFGNCKKFNSSIKYLGPLSSQNDHVENVKAKEAKFAKWWMRLSFFIKCIKYGKQGTHFYQNYFSEFYCNHFFWFYELWITFLYLSEIHEPFEFKNIFRMV